MGSFADSLGATDTYQAKNPLTTQNQETLAQALQQGQYNLNYNQNAQQDLAQALLHQSQGQGANPAQSMLNQSTNQNIAQNAGMIASQKGINPALVQRQAAENAAQMGQQAASQGAIMNAQQQLGAQQGLGNLYGQIGQQNLQNVNVSGGLINQAALGAQQVNASSAAANAQAHGQVAGGLLGGAGAATAGWLGAAHGAVVPGHAQVAGDSPKNDTVPAMLSPGEVVIPRSAAEDPEKAKEFIEHLMKGKKSKDKGEPSYAKVLQAKRKAKEAA